MQINTFLNYTPIKSKPVTPSFKADLSELNELWEDNPSTAGLWEDLETSRDIPLSNCFYPPNIKIHQVWDEVLGFKNLKDVDPANKIYTGYTLVKTPEKIKELRDIYEVKTIVDLVGYKAYKKECEEAGMNYFGDFNLYYNMYDGDPFLSQEDYITMNRNNGSKEELIKQHKNATLKFNKKLNKLVKVLDKGNVYMGCDHGHSRTNDVILLVNSCSDHQLRLDEDEIKDLSYKKCAIQQFKKNVAMYSKDKAQDK